MSYSNPTTVTYSLGSHTTTGALATSIVGPKGRRGRIRDVLMHCTTTHVLGTTPTKYQLGDGTEAEEFAAILPPAATAPTSLAASNIGGIKDVEIPADTVITAKSVANATGTPAGVFRVDLVVDWF